MVGNITEATPWDDEAAIVLVRDFWGESSEELSIGAKHWWLEEQTLENEQLVIGARAEDASRRTMMTPCILGL